MYDRTYIDKGFLITEKCKSWHDVLCESLVMGIVLTFFGIVLFCGTPFAVIRSLFWPIAVMTSRVKINGND